MPFSEDKREGMRLLIWAKLYEAGEASASELSGLIDRRVEVIRPRLTELLQRGRIADTGARRDTGKRGPQEKVYAVILHNHRVDD